MTCRMVRLMLATATIILLSSPPSEAQLFQGYGEYSMPAAGQQVISTVGTASAKQKPTILRMYLELVAKGSNLDEALKKMQERRDGARSQLETLKADKDAISFSTPGLSTAQSSRQRQIEAMLMERMRSRARKSSKSQTPSSVTVNVTLTAQWSLKAETPEKILLMAQDLQEKIKAADLAGSKEAEKLSPEEQEIAEEAANMAGSEDPTSQIGQPHFIYVAIVSKDDREKLLGEAFSNAKVQATDLAKAANVELGSLTGLSGQCGGQSNFGGEEYEQYSTPSNIRRLLMQQTGENNVSENKNEAISTNPAAAIFTAYVRANFQLGKNSAVQK